MTSLSPQPSLPRRTPRANTSAPHSGDVTTAKTQEAVDARDALATALSGAGIQLPAMDVRTPWRDAEGDGSPRPDTHSSTSASAPPPWHIPSPR